MADEKVHIASLLMPLLYIHTCTFFFGKKRTKGEEYMQYASGGGDKMDVRRNIPCGIFRTKNEYKEIHQHCDSLDVRSPPVFLHIVRSATHQSIAKDDD
jgi:hypothetical protein